MIKCSNCGKELSNETIFCDVCGTRVVSASTTQSTTPYPPTQQQPTQHPPTPHPPASQPTPTTSSTVPNNYATLSVILAIAGPFVYWYFSQILGFAFGLAGIINGYEYKNRTAKIAGIISTVINILLWLSIYG